MKYYDKYILFICCHLAAGHEKETERNDDLNRICSLLQNSTNFESRIKLKSIKKSLDIEPNKFKKRNSIKIRYKNINGFNINNNKRKVRHSLGYLPSKAILFNEENNINLEEQNDTEKQNLGIHENDRLNSTNKNNQKKSENNELEELLDQRNRSFSSIENENSKKNKLMIDYDFVILSGDLNYRININNNEIKEIMNKNDPEILWDKDQLTEDLKKRHNLKEGIIKFMPTYKYKINSNEYDYSRIPGWTDRILYKSKKYYDIMLCEYSSINNILLSDHRPVYAIFKINFKDKKFINDKYEKKKEECCII